LISAAAMIALAAVPLSAAEPVTVTDPAVMPVLTAPIALMVDVNSGRVLFERQSHRRFVPASLAKIMTSYLAFELIAAGKLNLARRIRMSPQAYRAWHRVGSTMFLADGSDTTVAELLDGIITVSANDGCVVLAEGVAGSVPGFTAMMNATARKLGLKDTHFNTPNGWMDDGETYTSAADLAALSTAMITRHPALYRRFYGRDHLEFRGIEQPNHNPLYGTTAGADGVKTGFTNEAGYGLVGTAIRGGRRLMMVVGGYDRPRDRAAQARAFMEWGFAAWEAHPLFAQGVRIGQARVQGGAARAVDLVAPMPIALTLPKGARARYSLAIRYKGPLKAPIALGEPVATLVVRADGQGEEHVSLVAARAVPKGGLLARLGNGFAAFGGQ
jgi:serine-type D-Ala-D-Ala carboxypeptidase (penicillin-binding protein 5/6)